jgi:peptidyl-prolyl cis-trans isomerase B (cyclophilin B)
VGTAKRERKKANRQQRLEELQREQQRASVKRRGVRIGVIVVVVLGAVFLISRSFGGSDDTTAPTTDPTTPADTSEAPATTAAPETSTTVSESIDGATPCPPAEGEPERVGQFEQAPPDCLEDGVTYFADVVTNLGSFTIELDARRAPVTVNNFVVLSRYRYFDGTECHRAIPDFVVQCGDPTATGSGGPGYSFEDELPEAGEYEIGSIAMANSGPDTNGSQFFVITGPNGAALPPNYSLFGTVIDGLDTTVAEMDALGNPESNGVPPLGRIAIESVTIRTA